MLAAVVFLAGSPGVAGAQEGGVLVAELARPTPVSAVPGGVLHSDFDRAAGRYRLVLRSGAAAARVLPFTPQRVPFEADLGTDSAGRPAVIASVGGDLRVLTIGRDTAPRPVRNVATGEREHAPTIDRGRVAFARSMPSGDIVYTKRLTTPRRSLSTRLPGVPTRRCDPGRPTGASCTTGERQVEQLDLVDGQLAQHVRYRVGGAAAYFQDEVRWVTLATRQARQVAHVSGGESVQRFEGVQLAGSRIGWYRGCERACPRQYTASFRYRPGVGYDVDPATPGGLSGYADTGVGTWQVRGAALGVCEEGEPNADPTCSLVQTRQPRWQRIAADRVRLPR